MNGPRPPSEAEFSRVMEFLDTQLRPGVNWSLSQEYPQVFAPQNRSNIRIISEQDKIISHAVTKILLVKAPAGLFKVAAIGSVVTHPEHRHTGLSGQILTDCLQNAQAQGCDFAILWTDLFDHYRKFGFELAGSEISIVLENEFNVDNQGLRFVKGQQVAPEALLRLYAGHTVGTLRTLDDIRQYLKIPNSTLYTAWDEHNQLQAYAVEGRGADLSGYIHEWGGGVSKLLPLLSYIRRTQNRPITAILPQHSINLIQKLKEQSAVSSQGYLGMIKLLDTRNLFFKIHRYARALGIPDLQLDHKDGEFIINVAGSIFKTQSEIDMVQLIFGPATPTELLRQNRATAEVLEKVLPLPMWIWGWDSV